MEIGDKGLIIRRGLKPLTIPLGAPQVGDKVVCMPDGNRQSYVAIPLGAPQVGDTVALLPEGGARKYVAVSLEAGAVYEKDYYLTIGTGTFTSWPWPINCGFYSAPNWGGSSGAYPGVEMTRQIKAPVKNTELNVVYNPSSPPPYPYSWFNICGGATDLPGTVYNCYMSTEIKGFIDVQFVDYPAQYAVPLAGAGSFPDTIYGAAFNIANTSWPSENGVGNISWPSWTKVILGPYASKTISGSAWSKTIWTRNYGGYSYNKYWVISDCDISFRRWRLYGDSAP